MNPIALRISANRDWLKISDGECDLRVVKGRVELREGLNDDVITHATASDRKFSYSNGAELYAKSDTGADIEIHDHAKFTELASAEHVSKTVHAVVGLETNIYFERLGTFKADQYQWSVIAEEGTFSDESYKIKPTSAGELDIVIRAHDARDYARIVAVFDFKIKKIAATPTISRKILTIGDSLIADDDTSSDALSKLKDLIDSDSNLSATFVGSRGRKRWMLFATGVSAVAFEPSTTAAVYAINNKQYRVVKAKIAATSILLIEALNHWDVPPATGTLTKVSGAGDATITYQRQETYPATPFWDHTKNALDVGYYLKNANIQLSADDIILIELGGNDFTVNLRALSDGFSFDETFENIDTLISQFRAVVPNINIVFMQHPGVGYTQPFDSYYAQFDMMHVSQIFMQFSKQARKRYNKPANKTWFMSTSLQVHPVLGYLNGNRADSVRLRHQRMRVLNPFHLNPDGHHQNADAMYAFIKSIA